MTDLNALAAVNANRWANAKLIRNFTGIARALATAKPRYQAVEVKTGVPWFVIAVIHERESSQNWNGSLAQGDPWNRASKHIPKGRGPFNSWEEAAVDALVNCPPYLARHKDWSLGGTLTGIEMYNGAGYAARDLPSPYLWAGTDQYHSGKFVRDGVFNPGTIDTQPGCAGLLKGMIVLDPSITFSPQLITPSPPQQARQPQAPWLSSLISFALSLLGRK